MTTLSALEVADYWTGAGGPKSRVVEWVAISYGESSFDDEVVSDAGAIGLWQIMPENAAPNGVTVADLYNPAANAHVAVQMSGHGANCAAWDSCYTDIEASGRLSFLGWPQPGSADYHNLGLVSVMLGHDKIGGAAPPPGSFPTTAVDQATMKVNTLITRLYPALDKLLIADRVAFYHMYRR